MARCTHNVIPILWIKLEEDLILPTLPLPNIFFLSNMIRTHNHLVRKRTLNHLAKLAK